MEEKENKKFRLSNKREPDFFNFFVKFFFANKQTKKICCDTQCV